MATIRAAGPDDLDAITEFLAPRLAGPGGVARYRRYFEYSWLSDKPNLGYLIDDEGIRGFIGGIYAERLIRGQPRRFCNITSIWVEDSHRKLSLAMFKQFLDQPGYTFTSFSPTDRVAEILAFFKFQRREAHKVVYTPVSGWRGLLRRTRVWQGRSAGERLVGAERRIYEDHRPYACGHFLIERGSSRCYVVTARRGRGLRAFADVIHVSNPALLCDAIAYLHGPIGIRHRTPLIGLDRAWVASAPRGTFVYDKLRPRMIRPCEVLVDDVDNLYSEQVAVAE